MLCLFTRTQLSCRLHLANHASAVAVKGAWFPSVLPSCHMTSSLHAASCHSLANTAMITCCFATCVEDQALVTVLVYLMYSESKWRSFKQSLSCLGNQSQSPGACCHSPPVNTHASCVQGQHSWCKHMVVTDLPLQDKRATETQV